MNTSIHSRALLVCLSLSTWTARKYDRKVSDKVNAEFHASSDAGRYNKFLLPGDALSYKALITLTTNFRAWHYGQTLAWSDGGWRLLPTANYLAYTSGLRERTAELQTARAHFVADYPSLKAAAQLKLNGLFRDEDYPDVQDIGHKFRADVQYSPVPATGDLRVDLSADQISDIEASIGNRADSAVKIAIGDAWQRLHDCVSKIAERLTDPDAIFRDSLIRNAEELCQALTRLNVTNDSDLEAMRARVAAELTRYTPSDIRDSTDLRKATADKAQDILTAMSGLFGKAVA